MKNLSTNEKLLKDYNHFFLKEQLAHITANNSEDESEEKYDIGKVHCFLNVSLNECLFSRASITKSLFSILLRFRADSIAMIADIKKAFLQIVTEKQTSFDFCGIVTLKTLIGIIYQHLN